MAYPFQPNLNIDIHVSCKLKVISVAAGQPITRTIGEVIDYFWNHADQSKLKAAQEKLNAK